MTGKTLKPWALGAVSAEAMKTWADILGDANPIHIDEAAAAALGFGSRTVNQGPANLAYVMNMLAENMPDAALASIAAQFRGNVLSGDAVVAEGTAMPTPDGMACTARLTRGNGETVLTVDALMRAAVPEGE